MPTCLVCGRELNGDFAFCPSCGAAVAAPATPTERQRRVVTILFCDLVGSTAAAEGADVEDVERRLTAYHDRVRERIEAYGGLVEKFVGDAVMAVFGAPIAHEDDAERAVRAGLAIAEVVEELPGVRVRVGVNTGEALVAMGARPEAGESYVIGDTVNTAARLQSAAPVDTVVVAESTYRATDRVFEYAELEAVTAKGKAEPLSLWQALAAKARFGTDLMRNLEVPLIGRGLELATLVNAFERAQGGQPQVVTVIGEAGVGKSRLVAELFAHVDRQPFLVTWRQGRCLPYGDGIAFWALSEIVKAHLGVYDGDADDDIRAKLDVLQSSGMPQWVVASLAALVGLPGVEAGDRAATFDAWRQFFEAMTEDQPAVVVIEDLHWADAALLDFLEHLADWPGSSRLLLVTTARPELLSNRPTWTAGLANAATIRLTPLSEADTEALIGTLTTTLLPAELRARVVERSGGNPLYAEELVRMLRDRASSAHPGDPVTVESLPETVQALIAARLDTLTPPDRELLQAAAVVGKVFWSGAVGALVERSRTDIDQALAALARKDLLRPMRRSTVPGDHEWAFTHVLIRDVAYQQQVRKVRAQRHLAAAQWLVETSGDRIRDVAEILVHHTATALELAEALGDDALADRARPVLRRSLCAAARHLRGLEQERALVYADRAVALLHDGVPPAETADVFEAWCELAVQTRSIAEALDAVDRALVARQAVGDLPALARTLVAGATWARNGHEPERLAWYRQELEAVMPQLPMCPERTVALAQMSMLAMFDGDNHRSLELAATAVADAEQTGEPRNDVAADAWISGHNALGLARYRDGDQSGHTSIESAIRVAERWQPHRALYIGGNLATGRAVSSGLREGLAEFDRVVELCRQRGLAHSTAWIESASLVFRLAAGDVSGVVERVPGLVEQLRARGSLVVVEALSVLASSAAELGRSDEFAESVGEVMTAATADLADPVEDVDTRTIVVTGAVDHLLATGATEHALDLLRHTLQHGRTDAYELYPRVGRLARAAHQLGEVDLLRALPTFVPDSMPMGRADGFVVTALTADLEGLWPDAVEAFTAATVAFEGLDARLEAAYARLGAGSAAARGGRRSDAVREGVASALADFESMQAWPAAERCRAVLSGQR